MSESNPKQKPDECDSCGFVTTELTAYDKAPMSRYVGRMKWLCQLCAGTHAGTALDYPEQFPDRSGDVLRAISFVGNTILAAIKDNRSL